jgi:hypothetical protein
MKLLGLVGSINFCFSSFNVYILHFILVRTTPEYSSIVCSSITSTDDKQKLYLYVNRFLPYVCCSYAYALEQLKLHTLRKKRYHLDTLPLFQVYSAYKFFVIWKLLIFKYLLGISEAFHCSLSALQVKMFLYNITSISNVVCRDIDVFGTKVVSLNHIL